MIDTHAHLLPGLDDGAESLEQSLAMAREMVDSGTRDVICTPHLRERSDRTATHAPAVLEELRSRLAAEAIPLRLHLGYELSFSFVMEADPVELHRFTLTERGRFLLVEIPHAAWPPFAEATLHDLRLRGFVPILAHPERNERVQRDEHLLPALLRMGALAQGTSASLFGLFGPRARRTLIGQIERGQIAILASDAHYRRRATWSLAAGLEDLRQALPGAELGTLAEGNPWLVLRNEDPVTPGPLPTVARWRRYLRGFGRSPRV